MNSAWEVDESVFHLSSYTKVEGILINGIPEMSAFMITFALMLLYSHRSLDF